MFFYSGNGQNGFTAEGRLQANGSDIKVEKESCPWLVDWNNDGLLDLMVAHDDIRLYLNSGTKTVYKFTDYSLVEAGSRTITADWSLWIHAVDLDLDGLVDLVIADDGPVYFYKNIGSKTQPELASAVQLKTDGSNFDLYYRGRISVADWNEDGALDIIGAPDIDHLSLYLGIPQTKINSYKGSMSSDNHRFMQLKKNQGGVTVVIPESKNGMLVLSNSKGQTLKVISVDKQNQNYKLPAGIPVGVYYLTYKTYTGEYFSRSIVIEK